MTNIVLKYSHCLTPCDPRANPVLIIGQLKHLNRLSYETIKCKLEHRVPEEVFKAAVSSLHPSPTDSCALYLNVATVAALPLKCSRHNTPSRSHFITKIVKSLTGSGDEFIVLVCERNEVFASACAVARAFSLYSRRSTASPTPRSVTVEFVLVGDGDESLAEEDALCFSNTATAIRLAAYIVDMPCNEMHTDAFLDEIRKVGDTLGIQPTIIQGEELNSRGFGGIHGVGKSALHLPALAVLSHTPPGATETIAWVGKGIVYDTGGLSLKGKTAMPGMKRDCGGAAAILGAFYAAVKQGFRENLHAVFCIAENSIGPLATRPDDIHTLYSGRTVEINNTDAEGRLVLADGVAFAQKDLGCNIILDMATLTGAQGIATGKYHAAILTNNEDWEVASGRAGINSGDLVHPLPYCPELHFPEFASAVADMKNSVADRSNAQPSCAGLFVAAHLGFDYPGVWIHVDMAGPVHCGERATGYGVALLLALFGRASHSTILQAVSPLGTPIDDNPQGASKKIRLV